MLLSNFIYIVYHVHESMTKKNFLQDFVRKCLLKTVSAPRQPSWTASVVTLAASMTSTRKRTNRAASAMRSGTRRRPARRCTTSPATSSTRCPKFYHSWLSFEKLDHFQTKTEKWTSFLVQSRMYNFEIEPRWVGWATSGSENVRQERKVVSGLKEITDRKVIFFSSVLFCLKKIKVVFVSKENGFLLW